MKRGRPKGHSPYIAIPYEELGDWVGRKSKVLVCRKWYKEVSGDLEDQNETSKNTETTSPNLIEQPKIEYTITHL